MKTNEKIESMLRMAHAAARIAVKDRLAIYGEGAMCGFAWCSIEGNEPLARYCRRRAKESVSSTTGLDQEILARRFYGSKGYPKGWRWWNPGDYAGQSIDVKEEGARAFREKMAEYGIRVDVGSRYD
jgi:hypothetical protein